MMGSEYVLEILQKEIHTKITQNSFVFDLEIRWSEF